MNLIVSSSPHIRSKIRTQTIMRDVLIALLPALLAGIWVHGLRALLVTLTAAAAAVLAEGLFCMITKRNSTVSNLSSAVTGILLAMTLPASVPYWAAALGSIFAIVVVKGMSGGIGKNIFNPALAGRAFLMLLVPSALTRFSAFGVK